MVSLVFCLIAEGSVGVETRRYIPLYLIVVLSRGLFDDRNDSIMRKITIIQTEMRS